MSRTTLALVLLLAGCAGPDETPPVDMGGPTLDAGADGDRMHDMDVDAPPDGGVSDARVPGDTSVLDTGSTMGPAGFGVISGSCGALDDELMDASSSLVENTIDFGNDPYDDSDLELLTPGGQEIIADGNAGGSSLLSEVFAYEVLSRCEGAVLVKTETEVVYDDPMGKITDLLVEIDGTPIGVSVTRAVGFPREDPYTVQQAEMLLTDKLNDIEASSANVSAEDGWVKQVLHVIAYAPGHAQSLRTAYAGLAANVVDDTIVWITVSNGDDDFLY